LDLEQLQWQYRPDGWTIRQLVHHCADSHMNAFIRFKLAVTASITTNPKMMGNISCWKEK
jgi:hypothetical protein